MITGTLRWVTLAALAGATPTPGRAQGFPNHLYDRFQATASLSLLLLNSTIRLDRPDGSSGSEIDVENDLGLSRGVLQPHVALRWKPGRRHELELGIQLARRSGEEVVGKTIDFGSVSFEPGLRVETELRTDQLSLAYRYAFMARAQTQVGLGLGLGVFRLAESLSAATAAGPGISESTSLPGPTASLGLFGRFRLGERLYLGADARAIYVRLRGLAFIDLRRLDATVGEAGASLRYFFARSAAAELGYTLGLYHATLATGDIFGSADDADAKFHYSVNGVRAGVTFTF